MKRIFLIIILVTILLPLNACKNEFTFRDNYFGDSLEQVKKSEGVDGEIRDYGDYKYLYYDRVVHEKYSSTVSYIFKNDEL